MARANSWTNDDGLFVGFGTRDSKNDNGATVQTEGNVESFSMELEWDNLPAAAPTAPLSKSIPIPANSTIHRATLSVTEAFTAAGGATLDIGFKQADGTDIDLNGIDAVIAITVIDAIGDVVQCNGALVGGLVTVRLLDAYISTVVTTGPFTAGMAELTIEYSRPLPDSDPTDPIDGIVGAL